MTDETHADPPPPLPDAAAEADPYELPEADDALLRELGQWLHAREAEEALAPEIELLIAPPPPPLTAAQIEARVDAVLGRPRRAAWRTVVSHGAVAAATVVLAWTWSSLSNGPDPTPIASYELTLRGGEGRSFNPSDGERTYPPDSTFEFKLRPNRSVAEPVEVVMKAGRPGDPQVIWIQLGPELFEANDGSVLHYSAPASSALPLAPGRWALTFEVGAPGACLSSSPERRCEVAGHASIVIPREGEPDAPTK